LLHGGLSRASIISNKASLFQDHAPVHAKKCAGKPQQTLKRRAFTLRVEYAKPTTTASTGHHPNPLSLEGQKRAFNKKVVQINLRRAR
jgi:hypothetical protein